MQQINFYQTKQTLKDKTIFTLIEKCYLSGAKILVLTPNPETTQAIDKLLWVFSQKKFIPHGTEHSEYLAKQPIYITHLFENPNNAQVLIALDFDLDQLEIRQIENFTKILIIYENEVGFVDNKQFSLFLKKDETVMNYYLQNDNGSWQAK